MLSFFKKDKHLNDAGLGTTQSAQSPLPTKTTPTTRPTPTPVTEPVGLDQIRQAIDELESINTSKHSHTLPAQPTADGLKKEHEISLYKRLLSGLYDGILIFDSKGNVIGCNNRAEHFFGYTESEAWGMHCQNLVAGMNTRMLGKLHEHAQAGRFTVVNGTCKRKNGSTFPAEIAISRIHLLNEGDLIFSIRNLERREKVREFREMSDEAVRSSGAGIAICTVDGTIEFVNAAFLKLVDTTDEQQVLKRMIGDYCTSYDAVKAMIHSPSAQGTWLGTIELQTPKGINRKVLLAAALSHIRHGAAPHLVLTMISIPTAIT